MNGLVSNVHVKLYQKLIEQYSTEFKATFVTFGKKDFYRKLKNINIYHGVTLSRDYKSYFLAKLMGVKTINHWMGSDVQHALTTKDGYRKVKITNLFVDMHLACSQPLVDELSSIGIKAHFMPVVPPRKLPEVKPLPEKFSVLAYLPDERHRFYGSEYIHRLAEDFPNVEFNVVSGNGGQYPEKKNVHYLGFRKDMDYIYANTNVLIRMVEHDGFSLCVQEALANGRHVIYSYPNDHCRFASNYEDIIKHIEALISEPNINIEGHEYIKREFNPQKISDTLIRYYKDLLSKRRIK